MNRIRRVFGRYWLCAIVVIGVMLLGVILYGYGSRHFVPNLSTAEVQTINQSSSLKGISENPLWIHYKLAMYGAQQLGLKSTALRFISGIFTFFIVLSFYYLCRKFYSQRVSVLTTALFGISAIVITLSRVATPAVLLLSLLSLIATVAWFKASHMKRVAPFILFIAIIITLYVPGAVWLIGLLAIWFWKDAPQFYKHFNKVSVAAGALVGLLLTSPLIYAFIQDPSLLRTWLLLPQDIPTNQLLNEAKNVAPAYFYKTVPNPAYNVGNLPLLDAFSGTVLLLGLYSYRHKLRLQRTVVYIAALVVSIGLSIINANQLFLLFSLPFVYLMIAEGVHFLLREWRAVFPRNPLARFVGTLLMSIAVFAACYFHLNRYFLAWVNAPETKQIYQQNSQTL